MLSSIKEKTNNCFGLSRVAIIKPESIYQKQQPESSTQTCRLFMLLMFPSVFSLLHNSEGEPNSPNTRQTLRSPWGLSSYRYVTVERFTMHKKKYVFYSLWCNSIQRYTTFPLVYIHKNTRLVNSTTLWEKKSSSHSFHEPVNGREDSSSLGQ